MAIDTTNRKFATKCDARDSRRFDLLAQVHLIVLRQQRVLPNIIEIQADQIRVVADGTPDPISP